MAGRAKCCIARCGLVRNQLSDPITIHQSYSPLNGWVNLSVPVECFRCGEVKKPHSFTNPCPAASVPAIAGYQVEMKPLCEDCTPKFTLNTSDGIDYRAALVEILDVVQFILTGEDTVDPYAPSIGKIQRVLERTFKMSLDSD